MLDLSSALALPAPLQNPPTFSARELHEMLVMANATSSISRKRFIDALRTLDDMELYKQLGFPNVYAYAERTFRYHHSQVHEFLSVSRALVNLPQIAAAFESGEISFRLAARLSGVATAETESQWLEFMIPRRVSAVLAEIKDAKKKKRNKPREDGFGLPGLPVNVAFELSAEEHALFEKGIQKARSEIAQSLNGEPLEPKDVILVLLRRLLETEPEGTMTSGRSETGISPFTVVVHKCPECARGALDTADGKVELEPGALERIEREAGHVVPEATAPRTKEPVPPGERDRPNSPALRLAVCQRDGGRCQNPCCGRQVGLEGHGHHIEMRSLGGRTEMLNETYLCGLCHSLTHVGLLVIEGDPVRGLIFRPVSDSWTCAIRKELEAARALPVVKTIEAASRASGPPETGDPEARETARIAREILTQVGFSKTEARRRLEMVQGRKGAPDKISVEDLVKEALRL